MTPNTPDREEPVLAAFEQEGRAGFWNVWRYDGGKTTNVVWGFQGTKQEALGKAAAECRKVPDREESGRIKPVAWKHKIGPAVISDHQRALNLQEYKFTEYTVPLFQPSDLDSSALETAIGALQFFNIKGSRDSDIAHLTELLRIARGE